MKSSTYGFIGAGNMATAIIKGIIAKNICDASNIFAYDINKSRIDSINELGVKPLNSESAVAKHCDVIFLCVKPQDFSSVTEKIKNEITENKLIISIIVGISTDYIKKCIGKPCKVVRCMPNTPLLVGEGASALCKSHEVTQQEFETVLNIFNSCGITEIIDESLMNAITSVNGSSPAYVYLFAKAVIDGAERQGIDGEVAKRLFVQTLRGSASMLSATNETPEELIRKVASPKGTTEKALEALKEHGFEEAIIDAMLRCTKRADELGL